MSEHAGFRCFQNQEPPQVAETMSTIDELDETLLLYGVFTILGHKRRETASKLFSDGVTVVDVESLGDHCKATTDNEASASKVLYSILVDAEKRKPALADLARRSELRQAHTTTPNADSRRSIGPVEGEDPEKWERERRCRMANCLLRGDRWPLARVARELVVSEAEAQEMAEEGRALCMSPLIDGTSTISPKETEKARKQEAERSTDFRQRMRDDALRSKNGRKTHGLDWKQIAWHRENILEALRRGDRLDVSTCLRDKNRRGALAELEWSGEVLRDGPLSEDQRQSYKVATSDDDRDAFRNQFALWNEDDMLTYNARKAMGATNGIE